jgi:predicted RNA-binding Zn-ribbon protein involved in translation (DUF1610 family)
MEKRYRHIGYFYIMEDVKYLNTLNANQIIGFMLRGYGTFTEVESDDEPDIIDYHDEHDSNQFEITDDSEYLIRHENGSEDGEGWYLDIYKAIMVEDEYNNVTELCPHCEYEVELGNELKVQKCPHCGAYIVPCNLCPLLEKGICSGKCPLEELAKELNEGKE